MVEKNGSLEKALKVIDLFILKDRYSLKEIIESTSFSKAATLRILNTLVYEHYLFKNIEDNLYYLSNKFMKLSDNSSNSKYLLSVIKGPLDDLCDKTGFTVSASILSNYESLAVYRVESSGALSLVPNVGQTMPLNCSGSGKILTAFSDDLMDVLSNMKYIERTKNTIIEATKYMEVILKAKNDRFAVDDEEIAEGLFCIATVVLDKSDKLFCSISVSGYKIKMLEKFEYIKEELMKTAMNIENKLNRIQK